ncbi:membrane associated rhomboid family serine protease [Arthrobacter sp. GAS37]
MSKAEKLLFIVAVVLGAIAVLVVGYIWIGSAVFGLNTSRLDPEQGPTWPFAVVSLSVVGSLFALMGGILLAVFSAHRTPHPPDRR